MCSPRRCYCIANGRRGTRTCIAKAPLLPGNRIIILAVIFIALIHGVEALSRRIDRSTASPLAAGPRFHWHTTAFVDSSTHQATRHRTSPVFAQRWKYTRVTLLKDTPHVGKAGEVAIVNRNYAFNYLVPFGFARYTTRAELIGIVLDTEYKEALANVRKSSAVHMKARFGNDTVLPFETPAQSDGSNLLVSPLLPIDIIDKMREKKLLLAVDMLREQDIKILTDTGTITEFGVYKVQLNVDPEIDIQITADVKEKPLDTSFLKDVVPSESSQEPPSD